MARWGVLRGVTGKKLAAPTIFIKFDTNLIIRCPSVVVEYIRAVEVLTQLLSLAP